MESRSKRIRDLPPSWIGLRDIPNIDKRRDYPKPNWRYRRTSITVRYYWNINHTVWVEVFFSILFFTVLWFIKCCFLSFYRRAVVSDWVNYLIVFLYAIVTAWTLVFAFVWSIFCQPVWSLPDAFPNQKWLNTWHQRKLESPLQGACSQFILHSATLPMGH